MRCTSASTAALVKMPRGWIETSSRSFSSFSAEFPSNTTWLMIGFSTTRMMRSPLAGFSVTVSSENRPVRAKVFSARSRPAASIVWPMEIGR